MHVTAEEYRDAVDARGIVRPGALGVPVPTECFTVFVQTTDARVDIDAWQAKASAFLKARIGLWIPKNYEGPAPREDGALLVVAPNEGTGEIRFSWGLAATEADRMRGREAEAMCGPPQGLMTLAERCPSIWRVLAHDDNDAIALLAATTIAMVGLGPIVPPSGTSLFGVKTARMKLRI